MKDNQVTLTLSLPEVNQILGALAKLSYEDVFELIGKVQRQAATQLEAERAQPTGGEELPRKDESRGEPTA